MSDRRPPFGGGGIVAPFKPELLVREDNRQFQLKSPFLT